MLMPLLFSNGSKDTQHLVLTSLKVLQFLKCEMNVYNVNEFYDVFLYIKYYIELASVM